MFILHSNRVKVQLWANGFLHSTFKKKTGFFLEKCSELFKYLNIRNKFTMIVL